MKATHPARYPRPAVLEALSEDRHHVIEASAGTGKTFTIEHLVIDKVLRENVDITRLLVVTFTDRAAAELRARVRGLLAKLIAQAHGLERKPVADPAWELDDEAVRRLSDAMLRIDQASISTIHAFCQRLLTENAFAHQRLFAQRLMDGREIFSLAFRDYLRDTLAVSEELKPLLRTVLQGAGGFNEDEGVSKLEGTLYEALRRYGRIEPALDQAALEDLLSSLPRKLPTGEALYEAYRAEGGRKRDYTVAGAWELVTECVGQAREATGVLRAWALAELREGKLCAELRAIAEHLSGKPATLVATALKLAEAVPPRNTLLIHLMLPELRRRVKHLKESQGLYDFDDMLAVVEESLRGPNGEAIIATLRQRYRYALIDEFQDTDPVQWEVFRRVFVEGDSPCRLLVIGDPKQAIYGFRAADVETYLAARTLLCGTDDPRALEERVVRLRQNFRSSERMIAAYNLVLSQTVASGDPIFKHDPRITYSDQAKVSCGDPGIALLEGAQEGAPIHLLNYRPPAKGLGRSALGPPLAAFIAKEIEHLLDTAHSLKDRNGIHKLRAKDIFVLTRGRSEAEEVAGALTVRGIPHAFYKRNGLFQMAEVQDLLDVLAAVEAPDDPQARARAWLTPYFGVRLEEAERAHDVSDESPLVSRLRRWNELALRRDFRTLFSLIVDDSGLARRVAFLKRGEAALANTLRVFDLLLDEAGRRHATLAELVTLLRAWRSETATPQQDADLQPVETDQPAVQLMTMHASKGLEAPVVFLYGGTGAGPQSEPATYRDEQHHRCLWFGKVPEELKDAVALEQAREDERLLYVALTRAKVRLYLPLYLDTGDGEQPAKLRGMYAALNQRLLHLQREAPPGDLFLTRVVDPLPPGDEAGSELELRHWNPDLPLEEPDALVAARARAVRERRGSIVTSYTALSRHKKPAEVDREDVTGETSPAAPVPKDPLTSSAVVGIFLHDALEVLPLEHVRTLASREAFREDAQVRALVEPLADREGILPAQRPRAYDILFAALRTPLAVGALPPVPAIALLERVLRESEFAYPIPEKGHALLGAAAKDPELPYAVERGMVKGFIDLVFEHQGRLFFADWKSDVLHAPTAEAMQRHVEHRYAWQMKVYAVAVVRMLRIQTAADYEQRFGGFLYLFLREMTNTPEGQLARGSYFHRPSWDEVRGWERALLEHPYGLEEVA